MSTKAKTQVEYQSVYEDSDYWYHKGVELNKQNLNQQALDCYKQALKIVKIPPNLFLRSAPISPA